MRGAVGSHETSKVLHVAHTCALCMLFGGICPTGFNHHFTSQKRAGLICRLLNRGSRGRHQRQLPWHWGLQPSDLHDLPCRGQSSSRATFAITWAVKKLLQRARMLVWDLHVVVIGVPPPVGTEDPSKAQRLSTGSPKCPATSSVRPATKASPESGAS